MSFGVSSIALLHILDQQLQIQLERTRCTGYELFVLFIDQSCLADEDITQDILNTLRKKYSSHTYEVALLQDVFRFTPHSDGANPIFAENDMLKFDPKDSVTPSEHLRKVLSSLPSLTSRADMITILRTRLITSLAKENDCDSILWGDTTTRLAERILAETAKGRGYSLPWQTADGHSPTA